MKEIPEHTVLLMGPPNVGKSVLFNRLTGLNVSCANYAGTTVEFAAGKTKLGKTEVSLVDVPGTYTLEATNEAEMVAVDMLSGKSMLSKSGSYCSGSSCQLADIASSGPSAVLCVLDAGNLESSLYLLFQVLEYNLPVVAALNRLDLADEKGDIIDTSFLSRELGLPVVPTVAVEGKGFEELKSALRSVLEKGKSPSPVLRIKKEKGFLWPLAEELAQKALRRNFGDGGQVWQPGRRQKWGVLLLRTWPGLPLAFVILLLTFGMVVGLGMGLRQFILLPVFRGLIIPGIMEGVQGVVAPGFVQNMLIGEYGFLVKGLEWPFALVMPYVLSFYFALALLEDSGYLPRLGGLLDGLLNRIGLRGSGIIPLLLGYGCGIPAILATRALDSRKERLIITTMICLAVPCISQSGALIALLSERSVGLVLVIFIFSFLVMAAAGLLLDRLLKGARPPMVMEIPELLLPRVDVLGKKVLMRLKLYVMDGALPMVGAVALAALLFESGIMAYLGVALRPLVSGWLGLPQEAAVPLVLGIMRREMAVLPLLEMDLTLLQLFVGAVVGLFYVPCIAIAATLAREFNLSIAAGMLLLTSSLAFLVGGIFFRVGSFFL